MRGLVDRAIYAAYRLAYLGLRAWWFVRRPATHGTGVALWHEGKILLLRTSYRRCYALPGGFVRPGEPSEQAARREVSEEIGVDLSGQELRLAWSGTLPFESRQDRTDIWEATMESPLVWRITSHEILWAGWVHPSEALRRRLLPHLAAYLAERGEKSVKGAKSENVKEMREV